MVGQSVVKKRMKKRILFIVTSGVFLTNIRLISVTQFHIYTAKILSSIQQVKQELFLIKKRIV